MGMARNAIQVAVANGDKRLVKIFVRLNRASGTKQTAVRGAFGAFFNNIRAHIIRFRNYLYKLTMSSAAIKALFARKVLHSLLLSLCAFSPAAYSRQVKVAPDADA
jgi:hypothetical protein